GETVNLAVPSSTGVVQVAQVDSTFVLGATNWVDVEVPPHCSALGKIMYAFEIVPIPSGRLERRTQYTLGSRKELTDNLAEVRERGYAIVHEEFEEGLDALAAPVFGFDGRVVAAIGISGPTMRIAAHHEDVGRLLVDEAGLLSRSLKRKVTHR
ncbi:IclR family transcriptional regulator, partial [Brevibacterium sp.]|uniref:IclR family transcriptional regulator n=1 Tax=Brevibacterium sp. TaxID=1701 RepID=UPI0026474DAD